MGVLLGHLPHVFAHVAVPFSKWQTLPPSVQHVTPISDCAKLVGAAHKACIQMAPKPKTIPPAETIAYVLADLAVILIAARIVGAIFVKLKQPRVVGEIISGILIGPTLLGGHLGRPDITSTPGSEAIVGHGLTNKLYPVQAFAFLNLIGALTLVFFMFLVGLEVQQRYLKGRGKQIGVVSIAVIAVPVVLGFVAAEVLTGSRWQPPGLSHTTYALLLGAGLAVTAFPVMARVLQEKRMMATDMGATGIGAAAVVTPLMFLVLAASAASAKNKSGAVNDVAVKAALAVALVALLFIVVRPFLKQVVLRRFDPDKPISGDVLAVLLVGALLTGLAADRIGINSLNGGFLFGACVPQLPGIGKAVLDRMSDFVIVFLIPVFLAVAGIQTDFTKLTGAAIPGILFFLALMVAGKWFVGTGAGMTVGLKWKDANVIGVLMNCRGLMILVVSIVASSFNGITDTMRITFALGAIVTTLMTGPLVDLFVPKSEQEAERERSISGSLAGLAAMTGGPRVMLVPGDAAFAPAVTTAARAFIGTGGPPPQFLLTSVVPTGRHGDYVGAIADEEGIETERTYGWLRAAADGLASAEGVTADAVALQSPDAAADLAKLASEWAATEAIVARDEDARALEAGGIKVTRIEAPRRSGSFEALVGA